MTVWTNNKSQLAIFNGIADAYKKSHPNISSITFDSIPIDGYTTSLTAQIAGSSPPDLAWVLERDAPDFVASGALTNLAPTFDKTAGYNRAELLPAATKLWQRSDKLFAYPFSTSPFGVFYNKEMLAKAGVTQTPDDLVKSGDWTWENAEKIAARVASRLPGKSGLVIRDFDFKMWPVLASVWRGFGADAWSADGKSCGFDSPQMVDAMTFLHRAIFVDKALPGPGTTADFFAGESGMTVTQISRASLLQDKPFAWSIVPLPKGPAVDAQVIGQAGIGVLTKGKHVDAAQDFLAWFTNPENSAKLAQYFPPARKSQLNAETLAKASPLFSKEQLQAVVIDGITNGAVLPSHTDNAKLTTQVQAALDPLWKADADIPSVLGEVCKTVNPTLSQ
ncbi:ABC transporter substrate-binding protein [Terrabacter sp. C0L_2]|uniref:ABC transporter substrate-binding protein n=1 Tax=Terrabacter sp. C0L_2 TaxID=3108389 RepID=UPI002ED6A653|nr:sugar ABC transporter substrate-binding protein [Terrabacter sp. C0L_2]